MGKMKNAGGVQAPTAVRRAVAIDATDSVPTKVIRSKPAPPSNAFNTKPTRYTYALKMFTAERRGDGWYICRTPFTVGGEKAEWAGPFETIETAVLAIARRLATEVADRHTRDIERHKLTPSDPLYGLKPTTTLQQIKAASAL
jgi:hypothetical protein